MNSYLQLVLAALLLLGGCTPVISEQSRKLVDSEVKFATLRTSPADYIGKHVMLGGRIAGVRNSIDGAQLEVVQFDLTDSGLPEDSFLSSGRFLATSSDYLDAMIFQRGMLITLVGEVKGKKILRLDDMDYVYPLVAIRELYLWKGLESDRAYLQPLPPYYYDPYYYGYGYEPFWQRNYGPISRPR